MHRQDLGRRGGWRRPISRPRRRRRSLAIFSAASRTAAPWRAKAAPSQAVTVCSRTRHIEHFPSHRGDPSDLLVLRHEHHPVRAKREQEVVNAQSLEGGGEGARGLVQVQGPRPSPAPARDGWA